jgi:hypothetical protein
VRVLGWLLVSLFLSAVGNAQQEARMESFEAEHDVRLSTDPASAFWRDSRPIYAEVDANGRTLPDYRTEVRSRWTRNNIYFLFICPYQHLYLKPEPKVVEETYELWNWNVAEVFIGSDFRNLKRYKEFEVSPQGEWVDLDVNLDNPHHEEGWVWNSGFEHSARIDRSKHIWYAAMSIPLAALEVRAPLPGSKLRVNLFRTEGAPQAQKQIMWQPTMSPTFHKPERFGLLRLAAAR